MVFQLHPVFKVREMIVSGRVRCLMDFLEQLKQDQIERNKTSEILRVFYGYR